MKYFDKDKAIEGIMNNISYDEIDPVLSLSYIKKTKAIEIINANIEETPKHSKPKTKSATEYKNPDGKYDLPVGTKFIYKGKKCQVVAQIGCDAIYKCSFLKNCICSKISCATFSRKDKITVIFKEIK